MAEFKRLSDVEVVAEPTKSANVLIEENGVIKKAPKTAVGGAGGFDAVIHLDYGYNLKTVGTITLVEGSYDDLYNIILSKKRPNINIYWRQEYGSVSHINITPYYVGFMEGNPCIYVGFLWDEFCTIYISPDNTISKNDPTVPA